MHNYTDYGWMRGFNVVPTWGARIEEAWWRYDGARLRRELAPLALVSANTVRLWIEFTAWMADPAGVTASFLDAIAALDEAGLKAMPCLFNRWHNGDGWDYGGTYDQNLRGSLGPYQEYVRALVTPLASDERVLVWDLCNEPWGNPQDPAATYEYRWLALMRETVDRCGAEQPVTIGTHQGGETMDLYAPLMDVLCCHPYAQGAEAVAVQITRAQAVQARHGKPMLCNEAGIGSLDDLARAANARLELTACAAAGFGWLGWAPLPGRAVATRRDRIDGNGVNGEGYHPWFTESGELRAGLEWLTEPPKQKAPWL